MRYYEIWLSYRFITNKGKSLKDNKFISFITTLSIVGISLGVSALIVVLSVMNGFQSEITNKMLDATSHIELTSNGLIEDYDSIKLNSKLNPHVIGASEYVQGQVMITSQGTSNRGVSGAILRGVSPDSENDVSKISEKMISGNFNSLNDDNFNLIIGEGLSKKFNVKLGDKVTVIAPDGSITPVGVVPRLKNFTVSGIFKLGMYEYDNGLIITNIKNAQLLFRLGNGVSGVRIKVDDPYSVKKISNELYELYNKELTVIDWSSQHENFFKAIKLEKRMMFVILSLIVAVAAFNIVSMLVMTVNEKKCDISILKTYGAEDLSIMKIFIVQGLMIGFIGTIIGVFLGILISLNIGVIVPFIEKLFDISVLPGDIYMLNELPSELNIKDVAIVAFCSTFLTLISTIYPSYKASKMNPAEVLRYE